VIDATRGRGRRVELVACLAIAVGLVVLRAVPMVWHEQIFDSDQAIVGLMAKHMADLRWFPLFFYGQNYMLGVQAWIAVPFFWIGGPTLTMLRMPLLLLNVALPILVMAAMMRRGARPLAALIVSSPLIATPPVISSDLLSTLGASVEPLVYVLGLWALRRRPLAFGLLACFGTLHREFTVFALPAFFVAGREDWRAWGLKGLARAAGAAGGFWLLIDLLKRQINTFGPGSAVPETSSLTQQAATIGKWISLDWPRFSGCVRDAAVRGLGEMFGTAPKPLADYSLHPALVQGSTVAGLVFAAALTICAVRVALGARRPAGHPEGGQRLFLYLAIVAVCPLLAYGLNGGLTPGDPVVLRYLLLSLFLPVALIGAFYAREPGRRWQVAVGILIVLWAGANVRDNARFAQAFTASPPPDPHRAMANYLVAKGVVYGRAVYWDAYRITFLSRERVILASQDTVRIASYQSLVESHAAQAVTLVREPCDAGRHVAEWCVVGPPEPAGR
jgi:hypothetical protein